QGAARRSLLQGVLRRLERTRITTGTLDDRVQNRVHLPWRDVQRGAHFVQGRTRLVERHRAQTRDVIRTVFLGQVLKRHVAPLCRKVDVDVGKVRAVKVDEALE